MQVHKNPSELEQNRWNVEAEKHEYTNTLVHTNTQSL